MSRPVVEVADILRAQGDRLLERYQNSFSYQQLKAFRAVSRCRTAALGGHIDVCLRCGKPTSPITLVAIATAQSARHRPASAGLRRGNRSYSTPATSTLSSLCPMN